MRRVRGLRTQRVRLMVVLLALAACTSSPNSSTAVPNQIFSPAPHACTVGLGLMRGQPVNDPAEVTRLLGNHLPTWLPSGFGFTGAWDGGSTGAWAVWSDQDCRSMTVSFNEGRHATTTPSWVVGYDKPRACGNEVMGMGECIGYSRASTDGDLSVQTIGLSRSDADRFVQSIAA